MKHLENNSEWSETQLGQYSAISQDFETVMLYEAYPTPLLVGSKFVSEPCYHLARLFSHFSDCSQSFRDASGNKER